MRFHRTGCLLLAIALHAANARGESPRPTARPNIILIVADDLGWSDLACYGNKFHETPHLDRIAARGIRFTNAYSASSVCSPTRASLLTGKYPARLYLTHIIQAASSRHGQWRDPDWTPYLPLAEVTCAESLQQAGYATGLIGKWHLGGHPGRSASDGAEGNPLRQGFAENIAGNDQGQPPDYFYPYARTVGDRQYQLAHLSGGKAGEYLTDRLTDEAERFIDHHRDEPFFLMLSHFAPHTAMGNRLQAPAELIARVERKRDSLSNLQPDQLPAPQRDPVYAAMIASLDDSVGRLLKKLNDRGLADRTLIIFTSDNGGYGAKTSNLPLRGAKHSPYEGGLRVPAIITWPGHFKPGTSDVPIISTDVVPTMLAAAEVATEIDAAPGQRPGQGAGQEIDGLNLLPILSNSGRLPRSALYWHYPHCDTEPYSIVREGNLKLIEFLADNQCELYDLQADPAEKTNLAERQPETVARLRTQLAKWRTSVGAQLPIHAK